MWQLSGTKAHFKSTQCHCVVDLSLGTLGLRNIRASSGNTPILLAADGCLLRFETGGSPLEEYYARGRDLFVSVGESEQVPFRRQVYWRAIDQVDWFGFEAIISVQTSRWDVSPEFESSTHLPAASTIVGQRASLASLQSAEISYIEVVHSSNHDGTTVAGDCIKHHLFGGRLEKGVIRRARIRGLFVPAAQAARLATSLADDFEQSPPPLTT